MARSYNPHKVEQKWQSKWPKYRESYKASGSEELYYVLDMISYPSSEGLHMGHWRPYTIADVWARYQTLLGKKVLHPVGFDSFGLPAENAAIKTKTPPQDYTKRSIANFTRQIQEMGKMSDWSTLIETSSPDYYKWTQWLFVHLYKNGLAYRKQSLVNWCPSCQTVLANEQVVNGECERCGNTVVKKELKQWFLKITEFAEDLLNFEGLYWPDRVKTLQKNWIGKSEGAEIDFAVTDSDVVLQVFTTRPDTLYGVSYIVVAPEHPELSALTTPDQKEAVESYVADALAKNEIDRLAEDQDKTGVFTGSYATHPLTGKEVPIWVADYVIGTYGTGAVMAVPAHDQRDYEFAQKYNLPIISVVAPETGVPQTDPEFRRSIVAIVRNLETNEVLAINWGKNGGHLFIGGGLEANEDVVACATREIAEETGYANIRFVGQTGTIYHNYFAHSKNKARRIEATGLLFDLVDATQNATAQEADEEGKFTTEWFKLDVAEKQVKDELHALVFRQLIKDECYTGPGIIINSDAFNGMQNRDASDAIVQELEKQGKARKKVQYRLRDWLVSRQRYWGAPIPIVYCDRCGEQAVPESELPVRLPEDAEFIPTGGSPLERHPSFKVATCPSCGGTATRETDTLDTFVDSSWYFLRFTDPQNTSQAFDAEQVKKWLPVDFYVGGTEHSILHLLYARFIMHALYRLQLVPYKEPFQTFYGNGMVYLYGKKMSKSKGNVINPDDMVKKYGTDAMRGYILFMGPADQDVEWQTHGIAGVSRFLERTWQLFAKVQSDANGSVDPAIQELSQSLGDYLPKFQFNRCISALMIAVKSLESKALAKQDAALLARMLAPFFPHFAEEGWEHLGHTTSIFESSWPKLEMTVQKPAVYAIQVNGKVRATLEVPAGTDEAVVTEQAQDLESVYTQLAGKKVVKTVFVPGRIVNFVVE